MKKGFRVILWIIALCLIISFLTVPSGDSMEEDIYSIIIKLSSFIILFLALSGIIIIYRLRKKGIKINAKVEKYSFYSRGVNNYYISYNVDGKTYIVRASENDYRIKKEVEILISKKYPWIMLDKFQSSRIVIFALIGFIVTSLMFIILY